MDHRPQPLMPILGQGMLADAEWLLDDDGKRLLMVPQLLTVAEQPDPGTAPQGVVFWLSDEGGNMYGSIAITGATMHATLPPVFSVKLRARLWQAALETHHEIVHGKARS